MFRAYEARLSVQVRVIPVIRVESLYRYEGEYVLAPNTPVEVCLDCGRVCYDAAVLQEIEQRFFAIQNRTETPDRSIEMPEKAHA